jgi:hypothetical protein
MSLSVSARWSTQKRARASDSLISTLLLRQASM